MSNKATVTYDRMSSASEECKTLYDAQGKAMADAKKARDALVAAWRKSPAGQAALAMSVGSPIENEMGLTFTLQRFHDPKQPVTYTQLGESTLNLLLNSKLLTDAQKTGLLSRQFPTIFPPAPEPVAPELPAEDNRVDFTLFKLPISADMKQRWLFRGFRITQANEPEFPTLNGRFWIQKDSDRDAYLRHDLTIHLTAAGAWYDTLDLALDTINKFWAKEKAVSAQS